MAYKIYRSATFEEDFRLFPSGYKRWLEKIEDQLVHNPYAGDQLRVRWCREKKRGPFRVYYFIYENHHAVLFVRISNKDTQKTVINTIFLMLDLYKNELENLLRQD